MMTLKYSLISLIFSSTCFLCGIINVGPKLGNLWSQINSNSLVGFQSFIEKLIERNLGDPSLYFSLIFPLLNVNIFFYLGSFVFLISFVLIKLEK